MSDGESDNVTPGTPAPDPGPSDAAVPEATTATTAATARADVAHADGPPTSAEHARDSSPSVRPRVAAAQWAVLAIIAVVTAGADLWSKSWAARHLAIPSGHRGPLCTPQPGTQYAIPQNLARGARTLVRNYLDLHYTENCGGAWGLLHGARESLRKPFFLLVTLGAVAFIVQMYRTLEANQRMMRVALPLVLGGALGNLVDRVRLGYVVDFIDAHWRDRYHWPTFNVADVAITVGILLMLVEYVVGPRRARSTTTRAPS
jgi:signal peptidase II